MRSGTNQCARMRNDITFHFPFDSHVRTHKMRFVFNTKILRYIYTINIVVIFIVTVADAFARFCCEIYFPF